MKIKTADLIGPALDWAVATIENLPIRLGPMGVESSSFRFWVWPNSFPPKPAYQSIGNEYSPSTKWAQGGPIIEKEGLMVGPSAGHRPVGVQWTAIKMGVLPEKGCCINGSTPLIAAMRCYVASKLGDEVEVPNELV